MEELPKQLYLILKAMFTEWIPTVAEEMEKGLFGALGELETTWRLIVAIGIGIFTMPKIIKRLTNFMNRITEKFSD